MSNYPRRKRKMCLSLADYCHDKALESASPKYAAQWIELMDALLWCADPENGGDTEAFGRLGRDQPT